MTTDTITRVTKYLTFKLGDEVFGIEVKNTKEVLDFKKITKVPQAQSFMRGVVNVRGSVVPVIDLRLKFNMTETQHTVNTCIIVVEISFEGETATFGALADSVLEVIELEDGQIDPAPKLGSRSRNEFIMGIGKVEDDFVMILNLEKLLSSDEQLINMHSEITNCLTEVGVDIEKEIE